MSKSRYAHPTPPSAPHNSVWWIKSYGNKLYASEKANYYPRGEIANGHAPVGNKYNHYRRSWANGRYLDQYSLEAALTAFNAWVILHRAVIAFRAEHPETQDLPDEWVEQLL